MKFFGYDRWFFGSTQIWDLQSPPLVTSYNSFDCWFISLLLLMVHPYQPRKVCILSLSFFGSYPLLQTINLQIGAIESGYLTSY